MKVFQTNEIRNIALIGGAKSGKTTLAEAMIFEGGIINRRGAVEDKNTVSDYRPIELERQNSVVASVLYSLYDNRKINIIDTPGFDDFIGEVVAALKVADTAPYGCQCRERGGSGNRNHLEVHEQEPEACNIRG